MKSRSVFEKKICFDDTYFDKQYKRAENLVPGSQKLPLGLPNYMGLTVPLEFAAFLKRE